jgi:hypothetical protein
MKRTILDAISTDQTTTDVPQSSDVPSVNIFTWSTHQKEMMARLIKKDCVVVYADYMSAPDEDRQSNTDALENTVAPEKISKLYEAMNGIATLPYDSGLAFHQTRSQQLETLVKLNRAREEYALYRAGKVLDQYRTHDAFSKEFHTLYNQQSSRIPTYLIFGALHERSLTHKFLAQGVADPKIVRNEDYFLDFLPENKEELQKTIRSRVAQDAFLLVKSYLDSLLGNKEDGYRNKLLFASKRQFSRFDGQATLEGSEYLDYLNDATGLLRELEKIFKMTDDAFETFKEKEAESFGERVDLFVRRYIDSAHRTLFETADDD